MAVLHLTKDNFQETITVGKSVVDFWAAWCGPCSMIAPSIEALAEKYDGTINVCKVDIDTEPELAQQYGVMSIPTVILFEDGVEKSRIIGVQPQEAIEQMITA